jgi:hypothetical protein
MISASSGQQNETHPHVREVLPPAAPLPEADTRCGGVIIIITITTTTTRARALPGTAAPHEPRFAPQPEYAPPSHSALMTIWLEYAAPSHLARVTSGTRPTDPEGT